ncbi:MAG TPA: glycosyltransferase [Bradyrhizobium sp.]|uniref:glycosyltransferase n=1 Tax=Bradyrhizobium sp. TaxID=376 RepID=UPI002D7EA53E|nr:glycosyltransferase [Bradyrhizobium sp.]HET7887114.1 glycosyltransferase [Bradyrhizobium sp.]
MILEKLPEASVALHGDAHSVAITRRYLGPQHTIEAGRPRKFDVALVINDPPAVNGIADLGVPVVFVDSLSYVRKKDSEFPPLDRIAYYCAQKYPTDRFPIAGPLQNRDNVKWVDAIIPIPQKRRGGGGIVINLGGLYVHNLAGVSDDLVNRGVDAYLELVLFPLVELLKSSNRKILAICGNLNEAACRRLRALVPDTVAIGPQSGGAFERILTDADLLISAPGTTTLLQAASIDLPTILLPSENRSQIPNARLYTKPGADLGEWPDRVISNADFERMRLQGVGAVYQYFFQSIINAAASNEAAGAVRAVIRRVLTNAPADGILDPGLRALGVAGADQVARLIEQAALRHR